MSSHIHLLSILTTVGVSPCPAEGMHFGIPDVMRVFKSQATRQWNQYRRTQDRPLWQASYRDHIIRDENGLLDHWSYIKHNPARWMEDEYHI